MTERSMAVGILLALYTVVTVPVALVVAAVVAQAAGGLIPVFYAVLAMLCAGGAWAGGKLLSVATRAWDALWDADGRSWAVAEAERVVEQAGEKR